MDSLNCPGGQSPPWLPRALRIQSKRPSQICSLLFPGCLPLGSSVPPNCDVGTFPWPDSPRARPPQPEASFPHVGSGVFSAQLPVSGLPWGPHGLWGSCKSRNGMPGLSQTPHFTVTPQGRWRFSLRLSNSNVGHRPSTYQEFNQLRINEYSKCWVRMHSYQSEMPEQN